MKKDHLPHARRGPLAGAGVAAALAAPRGSRRGRARLDAGCGHRPGGRRRRVANVRTAGSWLVTAVAISSLCAPAALAAPKDMGGVVVPKPSGKVVQVGEGVSVRLEEGWVVRYRGTPAESRHAPTVELARTNPQALFIVYDLGYGSPYNPPQLLQVDFHRFLQIYLGAGEPGNLRTGAANSFNIGPGGVLDEGAGEGFTLTATSTSGTVYPMRGVAYTFKDTSTNLAVIVLASARAPDYTAAVQGQVEGMIDSIVSPGNN